MERTDVLKLFDLLEQLYQGHRRPRDKVTVAIWAEVLKPWSYAQVRDAAVRRARESRYFPDPSELAAYLPAQGDQPAPSPPAEGWSVYAQRSRERLLAWQREWHEELRARGLPNLHEALEQGMTNAQWRRMLEEGGVWDEDTAVLADGVSGGHG